jgi:hypothetical protein
VEADAKQMRPQPMLAQIELRSRTIGLILLGIALAAGAVLLAWLLHNAPYVMDEWDLMLRAQGGSATQILQPWNGHLLAVGLLLAHFSILLVGSSYSLLVALDIGGVLACSVLVYVFARRRIGPILALAPAIVPLFFSGTSAYYGTGIQFTPLMGINGIYSLDFGLAALILLEEQRRRTDIAACVMLVLSLASFSYGLAFAVGAGVAVALTAQRWARAYVVALPLGLYGLWRIWAGSHGGADPGSITPEHLLLLPLYVSDSLSAVSAGFFGLSQVVGRGPAVELASQNHSFNALSFPLFLVVVEITAIVCVARALGRRGLMRASLWPSLATLFALWSSQALVMDPVARMPGDPRYLFAGAVMVAVVASELARGVRISRFSIGLILAVAALGAVANLPRFREGKAADDQVLRVSQAAGSMIELAGGNADPSFVPAADLPEVGTMWIGAGGFQKFARQVGPLASMPIATLRAEGDELRTAADRVLVGVLNLQLTPAGRPGRGPCVRVRPGGQGELSPGAFVLRSPRPAPVRLGRFGDAPAAPIGEVPAGSYSRLTIPSDRLAGAPWLLGNKGSAALAVCKP